MKTNTVTLTNESEMVGFLKTIGTECQFVSMLTVTDPKMRTTGNPYKGVQKVSRRNGLLNVNFTNAVERNIAESFGISPTQVEYNAGKTWYKHLTTTDGKPLALCVHQKDETKYYLQYYPQKSETKYLMPDGTEIAEENLKPFLYEREPNDFKPIVVVLALASIRELKAQKMIVENQSAKDVPFTT